MKENSRFKTLSGIALGGIAIAICVGFLFVSDLEKMRRSLISQNSFCPVENPVKVWGLYEIFPPKVPYKIAVVVDATDRIPDKQRGEIEGWFKSEFVRSLDKFAKVAIYQLDENISDGAPRFEKCAPPSEANPWIENPKIVRKFFEEKFLGKLLGVVESIASGDEKNFSPIMEMTEKVFYSYDKMILVSDLMQNTLGYSLYESSGNGHGYGNFLRNPYAVKIAKNRRNKKLTVIYITRKKLKQWQNKTLRKFWREHMESNGGELVLAKTLSAIANK